MKRQFRSFCLGPNFFFVIVFAFVAGDYFSFTRKSPDENNEYVMARIKLKNSNAKCCGDFAFEDLYDCDVRQWPYSSRSLRKMRDGLNGIFLQNFFWAIWGQKIGCGWIERGLVFRKWKCHFESVHIPTARLCEAINHRRRQRNG